MKLRHITFLLFFILHFDCKKQSLDKQSPESIKLKAASVTDSIYTEFKIASNNNDPIAFSHQLSALKTHWSSISDMQKGHVNKRVGYFHLNNERHDSAFYYYKKAKKIYDALGDSLRVARVNMNIAIIKKEIGDYAEAEKNAFDALGVFENQNNAEWSSNVYDILGNIYANSKNFNVAETYLKKAIALRRNLADSTLKYYSINNLGIAFQRAKKYPEAINQFNIILKNKTTIKDDPTFIAMAQDNLVYSKFLDLQKVSLSDFTKPLVVRQKFDDVLGQIVSHLHISDYYKTRDKTKALASAETAYKLSKTYNFVSDEIKSMDYLIELYPPKKAVLSAKIQRQLIDSLSVAKNNQKAKFTRIAYETDKKEKENLQLKTVSKLQLQQIELENKRKWQFGIGLGFALIGLCVFTILYRKNKKQKTIIENLQRELHHRVKNNLSIIDTFIDVTKDEFDDPKVDAKLTELQNRIDSINEVHQQLHSSNDVANINLKKYVDTLAKNVQHTFAGKTVNISKNIANNLTVNPSQSFPMGLIINEFMTNSYKYAFTDNDGEIKIHIEEKNNAINLKLSDNGKGLPPDCDIKTSDSFGLRIMSLLSKQLNGTFDISTKNGVKLNITFPKL